MLLIMTRMGTRRNPEYKELNFDTAIRNPERLKSVLEVLNEYEGYILNDNVILDILYDIYSQEVVKSDNLDLNSLKTEEAIKAKIIEINKTRNRDGHFPKGYQSRFWTYMRTLSEFGFVYTQYNEKLIIGDVAKKLLKNVIDPQEAFGIQTMKYNWKSPYRNVSNDFNYFKFIIKVLRKLSAKNKKLSYNQFILSLFSREDDSDKFIELIENNVFPTTNSVYTYLKENYGKQNQENTVINDYPDTVLRMLRITGFVNIVNDGILLIEINNDSEKFVDYFMDKTYIVSEEEKLNPKAYFDKINFVTEDEMKAVYVNRRSNADIYDYNFVLKKVVMDYKLNQDKTLELINNIGVKGKNKEFKYIDDPLQFEFFISILLYLVYGDSFSIKPNYKTDSYGIPISHAPGNCGDIEVVGNGKYWLIEVTLIRNKAQQLNYETSNLFRHISETPWDEKYMSLIAPVIHEDTHRFFNALIIDYIQDHSDNSFSAKCYKKDEFNKVCVKKNIFEDMKQYTKDYEKNIFDILKSLM